MKPVQPSCWQSFCCCLNVSPVPVLFPQSMCVPDLFLIYSLWFSGLFCFLFVCFLLLWFPLYMHICNQFLSPSSLLFVLLYFWDFQLIKAGSLFFYQPACAYGLDRFRHQKNLVRVWKSLFFVLLQNNVFCCQKHRWKCADVKCWNAMIPHLKLFSGLTFTKGPNSNTSNILSTFRHESQLID